MKKTRHAGGGVNGELLSSLDFADPARATVFQEHLEKCRRCRDNPFNLCREGLNLLRSVLN